MRYVKVLFVILLFVVAMVFFIQNVELMEKTFQLRLAFGDAYSFYSLPIPLYAYIIGSLALGSLVTMLYLLADRLRVGGQLKACRRRVAALEQEVNSLRNLPLDNPVNETSFAGESESSPSMSLEQDEDK